MASVKSPKISNNMKISTKIYLGFSLLMAVLVLLGGYSLLASSSLGDMFSEYRSAARVNLILGTTVEKYLLARSSATQYRLNDNLEYVENAKKHIAYMVKEKDALEDALQSPEMKEKVTLLDNQLTEYSDLFDQGVAKQKQYKETRVKLDEMAPVIRRALTSLRANTAVQGLQALANESATAQESFLLARIYIDSFIQTKNSEDLERARKEIGKTEESLKKLGAVLDNQNI